MDNNQENSSSAHAVHIASLIHKVKEKEPLTDQERQELDGWREQGRHEDTFEELNDRRKFIAELREMDRYDTAEAVNVIFSRLGLRTPDRVRRVRTLTRRLSVAAIFLLAIGGTWLFVEKERGLQPTASVSRYKNDIPPGVNKAVLTLSGGKKIVLDSSATGTIGKQSNVAIVNNNGQLIYNALHEKPTGIFYNTLTTQRGNQYQVILPDGSKVWLNAASSITYPTAFVGKEREVTISGEAYFEVAKNEKQPFIVKDADMSIQVLGTHFNVNDYADEAARKTTLLEGSVRILNKGSGSLLKPGQQAVLDKFDDKIEVVDHPNVEEVIAWKNGSFLFADATIESIMRQVARWYDVEVVYNTSISKHFVADIPRDVPVSQLLKLLELTDQVHFSIEGKKITIIP